MIIMQEGSQVSDGKMIALRYCIRNMKDEVIEDIMQLPPVRYLHGAAGIHEDLQQAVDGMRQDEQRGFTLVPESATGPDHYFQVLVVIDEIRDPTEQELKAGNNHFNFTASECDDDCDCWSKRAGYMISFTSPPSTRNAAPFVPEETGLAT